jgi:Flp pilus assembly protein TadG
MENLVKGAFAPVWSLATKFASNTRGNVGMLFGLSAIPVMLAAGAAIDFSRIANAKANLIAGLDSSALYAAAITDKTEAQMKELARIYLDKNYTNTADAELSVFDLHNYADRVEATGTVKVKTWFMSIGGITNVDVNATSQIMKAGNSIEVSLVLDVTGSMLGTKLTSLKTAANDFVDTVVWDNQTPYYSKVAVIPFSVGVNMGAYANAVRGTLTTGTCTIPGCTSYKVGSTSYAATNCVTERIGSAAYTDAAASSNPVGRLYEGGSVGSYCAGVQSLVPLTADRAALHSAINNLVAAGGTAGQVGMAWGWYTISPNFGLWTGSNTPAAYPTPGIKLKKIAVFMTDGDFTNGYCNGLQSSNWELGPSCSATNGDPTDQAQSLCTAMKAKEITIYTIGFQLSTTKAVNFMHDCATDSTKAFDAASNASLKAAFSSIAQNLLELRVSK